MDTALPCLIYTGLLSRYSGDTIHVQGICPSIEASCLRWREWLAGWCCLDNERWERHVRLCQS